MKEVKFLGRFCICLGLFLYGNVEGLWLPMFTVLNGIVLLVTAKYFKEG